MSIIKWTLIAILITVISIFSALNSQVVELNYLIGKQFLPLAVLLFFAMFLGGLFASFFWVPKMMLFKHKIKQCDDNSNTDSITK